MKIQLLTRLDDVEADRLADRETILLGLTGQTPAQIATGVSSSAIVTATFSEPVQSGTVVFTLSGPGGAVAGTLNYDAATKTATLQPSAALAASTTYTATVGGAKDGAGNAMAAPFTWSFTTAAPSANTPPTLAAITDQAMGPNPATRIVPLVGHDPDGDTLTYSAQTQSLPYWLDSTYGLYPDPSGDVVNCRGQGEKYLRGTVSAAGYDTGGLDTWYYIPPSGGLYEIAPPYGAALTGTFIASLGTAAYDDPSILWAAANSAVPVNLSLSGNQLTIAPQPGYAGTFVVIATVDDGKGGRASRTFKVTV